MQRNCRPAPQRSVDRHSAGDRSQPTPEAAGVLELADLPHRLDEHVLAEFLGLGVIAQPAIDRHVHGALVTLDQSAERLPVAALRRANGFADGAVSIR